MDNFNFIFFEWEIAICVAFFMLGYCVAMWRQPRVKITDKLAEIAHELNTQTEVAQQLLARRMMEGKISADKARSQTGLPPLPKAKPKTAPKPKAKVKARVIKNGKS